MTIAVVSPSGPRSDRLIRRLVLICDNDMGGEVNCRSTSRPDKTRKRRSDETVAVPVEGATDPVTDHPCSRRDSCDRCRFEIRSFVSNHSFGKWAAGNERIAGDLAFILRIRFANKMFQASIFQKAAIENVRGLNEGQYCMIERHGGRKPNQSQKA